MKDLLRRYHKYLVTFGIALLFMIFGSLYMIVRYNLPQTVRTIILELVGADIESTSISFKEGGLIEVRDVTLKDGDELILDAPLVEISYKISHLIRGRIDEIRVVNPEVWITRDADNNINIVDAFIGGSNEDDEPSEEEEEAPYINEGSSVPIDKISMSGGHLHYRDTAYERPIAKEATDVSGYVAFDKKYGIDLTFSGTGEGVRGREELSFSYNDREHPYDIGVVLKDVSINEDLMQYAYDDDELTYVDGVVDLDMTINPDAFGGRGSFSQVKAMYNGLETEVTDGEGEVNFAGEKIYVKGEYMLGDDPGTLFIEYKGDEGVDIDFYLKDILFEKLEAYEMLGELELPVSDMLLDKVHVNLAFDSEYDLKVNIDFSAPEYMAGDLQVKDLTGLFYYEGGDNFYLKDVKFKGVYPNTYMPVDFLVGVDARLTEEEGELAYKIYDIESETNIEMVSGRADLDFEKKKFGVELDSKILSLTADLDLEKELFSLKQSTKRDLEVEIGGKKVSNRSELNFVYDLKEKSFLLGKGQIDINYGEKNIIGDISTLKDNIKFEKFKYYDDTGSVSGSGEVNLRDLSYKLNFDAENLDLAQFTEIEDLKATGSMKGNFEGKGENFEGNIKIDDISGEYFLKFNNLEGDIYVKNDGVFNSYFNGYLGRVEYEGVYLYDFQISASLEDDTLRVRNFGNNISNIYGSYNFTSDLLDFQFHIAEITDRELEALDLTLDISSVEGSITGSSTDIIVDSNLEDVRVKLPWGVPLNISGNLGYEGGNVSLNKLKVNKNIISGSYDLSSGLYSFKANLLEEDIPSYYGDINLKYRVLGEVYLWGDRESTKSYLRTSVDKVYLRGQQLPNLYLEGSFTGGALENITKEGRIDLKQVALLDEKREELLVAEVKADLGKKSIFAKTKSTTLDISKLSYLTDNLPLKGLIDLDFQIDGDFKDLKYYGDVSSDQFKIGDITLNGLQVSLDGNLDGAKLDEFIVEYEGNSLNAEGEIDLKSLDYYLNVNSSEIDLKFLNVFLYPFGVEDIEGMSTIDLNLKNKKNEGSFVVKGLKAKIPEYGIDIENVDSDIKLDNEKIFIDEFTGIVNEGRLSLEGFLDIPDFKRMEKELDPLSLLNYSLKLEMDRLRYVYKDVIEVVMSSKATLENNKITGNFIINRGDVKGIPEVSEEDVADIKGIATEAEGSAIAASMDLGEDFAITTRGTKSVEVDINLLIEEGIFINLEKVAPLVENLEAVIKGRGRLRVKDSRAKFMGELNSESGAVTINSNLFEVDRAVLLFDEEDEYLPNVNPTVMLNARSVIANEEVYILATGKLNDLEIILSSSSGLSQADIASLLAFHNTMDSSSSNVVVKNILDSQISRQVFNPVSGEIQRILRLSKFKISSDITAYEYQNGEYEESSLGLGASIEAENPIYKDKVFWNATARIADNKEGDSIDEYDFILEHRFAPSLSWGVGVGKLPEGRINRREDETGNLNYHIDFKFRKRYNSITEIFRRK